MDDQGNYEKALEMHQNARSILEEALGKQHPDVALSCSNKAGADEGQGALYEAMKMYREALTIIQSFWRRSLSRG